MADPAPPPPQNTFGTGPPDLHKSLASTTAPDPIPDWLNKVEPEDEPVPEEDPVEYADPEDEPIPEEDSAEYEDAEDLYKGTESPDTPASGQAEPPNLDQVRWVWNPDSQDFVFTKEDGTKLLYTVYQKQHDLKNNDKSGKPEADAKPRQTPSFKKAMSEESYIEVSENPESRSSRSSISSRERPVFAYAYQEPLNPQFEIVKKPGRFFSVGRIFKTPWFEPGPDDPGQPSDHEWRDACPDWHGTTPHAKFRWFVVVRRRATYTLCFCITTFGGPGAARDRRDNPTDFVVLHKAEIPPPPPYEEEHITRSPLKVIIEKGEQYISPLARLDCGRVYTVENNLRVLKIGRIHPDSLPALEQYYKDSMLA